MRPAALPAMTALCVAVLAVVGPDAEGRGAGVVPRTTVIPVTSCADSGPGSLREAIATAASGDTIDLSQLACGNRTITLASAIQVPIDGLTISGVPLARPASRDTAGAGALPGTGAIIDGGAHDRVFDHTGTAAFLLFGITLRNGHTDGPGGCLRSGGSVTLISSKVSGCTIDTTDFGAASGGGVSVGGALYMSDSEISGNAANGYSFVTGGGVAVSGPLTMKNSTISGNNASASSGVFGFGGGLYANSAASISYSTISGNSATDIGGADLVGRDNAALSITNTTISGNHGGGIGGLLALQAPLHIASSTIAFNVATGASAGTGGLAIANPAVLESTLVANNTASDGASDVRARCGIGGSCDSVVVTGSNNLIGSANLSVPADTMAGDPHLLPLADNGGPTRTHALAMDSPAIDHGNAIGSGGGCLSYDQRGSAYLRAFGAGVDIGAFELGAGPDRIFSDGFEHEALAERQALPTHPDVCP